MGHHNRRYNCKHQFRSSRGTSVGVTADGIAKEGLTLKSDWQERISVNPKVCHGKPCIKGTRIMVSINLNYLKAGEPTEEIVRQYPILKPDDIQAAVGYATSLQERR